MTRFFIPLIDVLTLLFCIFLLMPLVKAPADEGAESAAPADDRPAAVTGPRDAADAERLREELEKLRRERDEFLKERLAVRTLEIDAASGKLFFHDPERAEIRNQADALALVERDRKAQAGRPRDLYYLILYPRQITSPYPHREQREQYDRWFKDVPHGWDVPGLPPGRGNAP